MAELVPFTGNAIQAISMPVPIFGRSPALRDKLWEGEGEIPLPDPIACKHKKATVQRKTCLNNAKYATIFFYVRRKKHIFAVKYATNDIFHTSKRQLAKFHMEK